ncbi:putative pectin methylesterase family protein [Hibiscus syriacus]|uniref:Pectinesterase n=1 Tax=Hibiscus syriacus TaxID=106335 RepID=A0A6A2WC61_HIBSY|nr:putative pectin methylesterase family protein [Hibiscus syriacus]
METKLALFVLFSLSFSVSQTLSSVLANGIDYWCNKTPNPQPCKKCRNYKEKAAWADCLKLYQQTILQLNQTLDATECSDFDEQTWLSSALTNLETCRAGNASFVPQTYQHGFPSWPNPGDRKLLQSSSPTPNLVVAQDGSGNHRTIKEALDAASKRSGDGRFVIRVKSGIYKENLEIGNKLKNIMLIGDGLRNTIITGSRSIGGGPQNHQAVALRSGSDLSVFYRCGFEGYQDTLYAHSQRQFYKECYIYGTVDFIFGNAAAVLQNCMIYARRPMDKQKNIVTAQGRTDPNQNTGIVIHNSRVMAAADLAPVLIHSKRSWDVHGRKYRNIGPAASTNRRVKWEGYRVITSATEASKFTVTNFIAGTSWLPSVGIPFTPGL